MGKEGGLQGLACESLATFSNGSCRVCVVEKEDVSANECSEDVSEGWESGKVGKRKIWESGKVGYWEDKKGVKKWSKGDLREYFEEYGGSRKYFGSGGSTFDLNSETKLYLDRRYIGGDLCCIGDIPAVRVSALEVRRCAHRSNSQTPSLLPSRIMRRRFALLD
ncbi:hypothetical protein HAX54_045180 [Datura stramonium]|uniref:Uncharacterized protein n=1 Tax=Datura stramonium TaxID=4076 RepID=A0ABS8WHC5_DATST|nr:hypothetical protein [Datura stramonium]